MINRRSLLRRGAQSAVSLGMSSVVPFSLLGSAGARASDDYRAVVCVLLAGGADSYNILVPRSEQAVCSISSSTLRLSTEAQRFTVL
jgi:uncharacterized protein (DUF1501 family)